MRRNDKKIIIPAVRLLLLLLTLAQVEGHHAPRQVLHSLLVRQLLLRLAEELPDLGGQRIVALHLLEAARRAGGSGLERREQGGVEDAVLGRRGGLPARQGGGGIAVGECDTAVSRIHAGENAVGTSMGFGSSRKAVIVFCDGRVHRNRADSCHGLLDDLGATC